MLLSPLRAWRRLNNTRLIQRRQRIWAHQGYNKSLTDEEIRNYMRARTHRIWVPAVLALVALGVVLQATLLYLCALLVLSTGLLPEIWFRVSLERIAFRRLFSKQRVRLGDELTLTYQIENRKRLPIPWLELEDDLPNALELRSVDLHMSHRPFRSILLTPLSLWSFQRVSRRYHLRAVQRGIWACGPAYARSSDPFGFLDRDRKLENEGHNTVMVLPAIVPLEQLGLPSMHPFGRQLSQRRAIEDPSQIVGVRDYIPGDPLRQIHWKATARATKLQTKVLPPTTEQTLLILLDINTKAHVSLGVRIDLLELGIVAAASVASWATERRYAVGLVSNGIPMTGDNETFESLAEARSFVRVPPSTHPNQFPRLLETLARLQPYLGSSMEALVAREKPRLPVGTTIVYISAAEAISLRVISQLAALRRRGHAVTVLLTGDGDAEMGALPTYYVGDEEDWNGIAANALEQASGDYDRLRARPYAQHQRAESARRSAGGSGPLSPAERGESAEAHSLAERAAQVG